MLEQRMIYSLRPKISVVLAFREMILIKYILNFFKYFCYIISII